MLIVHAKSYAAVTRRFKSSDFLSAIFIQERYHIARAT